MANKSIYPEGYRFNGPYSYENEKPRLLTDAGQRTFIKFRDEAHAMLRECGAFRAMELLSRAPGTGDSFLDLAMIDRLVELGEIVCVREQCWAQYRVYSTAEISGR